MVKRFMAQLKEALHIDKNSPDNGGDEIEIEWPMVILMFKRQGN